MSKLEHTSWQDGLLEHERPSILDFIFFERGIVELVVQVPEGDDIFHTVLDVY